MNKSYKYKIEYSTPESSYNGIVKEIKVDTYEELVDVLGHLAMISYNLTVYCKVKGRWEVIRTIKVNLTPEK